MQLQVWFREWLIGCRQQKWPVELRYEEEVVSDTTVASLKDGYLTMEYVDGKSTR